MNKFTPLHIEILIYCMIGVGVPRVWMESKEDADKSVQEMLDVGLLVYGHDVLYEITEKGRAVIEHMCNTPMPEQVYVFPERGLK